MKKVVYNKYIKLFGIIFLLILSVLFIPFYKGTSLMKIIQNRVEYLALSEERQAVYDKMKIEYLNIKSRVTGTAPFNSGDESNTDGVDVSDSDDYVRTFDVMKYTIEVGIGPNTSHDGVTTASVYEGGVIKVRAKLPNQGTPTIMRWEQDAWMQNVEYSNDKTEIYAEYHVPAGVSVTNANQNLTFTVKVDGYKKEVTSEMAPEFEVWMEGNKPDDSTSSAESKQEKDTRNTYISGTPSFNAKIAQDAWLTATYTREVNGSELKGTYQNMGLAIALAPFNNQFSDFRGIEYPTGKIQVKIRLEYRYSERNGTTGWKTLSADTPNSLGILNATELIEYGPNYVSKPGYVPNWHASLASTLPYGIMNDSIAFRSVNNTGDMMASLENDYLTLSFENYIATGPYPTYGVDEVSSLESNHAYFISSNFLFFIPYFDSESNEYNYQLRAVVDEISYYDSSGNFGKIDSNEATSVKDFKASDNITTHSFYSYLPGGAWTRAEAVNVSASNSLSGADTLSQPYYSGNGSIMSGQDYLMRLYSRVLYGPYEGGMVNMLTWNPSLTTIKKINENSWYRIGNASTNGSAIPPSDQVKIYFGVYKANPTLGTQTDLEINNALFDDFDWYLDYSEALEHGAVCSVRIDDSQYRGNNVQRWYFLRFTASSEDDDINKIIYYRYRLRYFADAAREKLYTYSENLVFRGTIYDNDGNIINTKSHTDLGESIKIIGAQAHTDIKVTDTDSSGNLKSAYDVQDGVIHWAINPSIRDGNSASENDRFIDEVRIKVILANGLNYTNLSANKTPESVTTNIDGTTTIVWKYNNWQVNHDAPEYPEITFSSDISASLENNASLSIKSIIQTNIDTRDEALYRTSEYGVVIANLAGSKALKVIDKPLVEKNESFSVTSTLGNNSEEVLRNVKTIEILPTNNDDNGSHFSGMYTSKVTSGITGQRFFYTTGVISSIGLTEDRYGKLTIKDVDLENDSRWTEVGIGDVIPNNATAVASVLSELPSKTEKSFVMQFIPSGNKEADMYAFTLNMTTDNLQAAIKTNTVVTKVINRRLSGKAFIDENRNGIYDSGDTLLKTSVVKLLNESGTVVKTTQTNNNGEYTFENVEKGNYYVEFTIPSNYETIPKGTASKVNTNGRTDNITSLNVTPTTELLEVKDIDMGIQKISAKINVRYEEYGNSTNLFDSTTFDKFYGDTYNLDNDYEPNIPDNYEFKEKTSNYTGTVNQKEITIIYYYQKKDSKLTSSIEKTGTNEITSLEDKVNYTITYKTKIKDYLGNAVITIVDYLPYAIDLEHSNLDGGTYNETKHTITWTENKTIGSINEPEIVIKKDIELLYRDIDSRSREMINTAEGTITLDNNERSVQDNQKVDIKIPGTIIVHYIEVDEEGNKIKDLIDPVKTSDLIGKEYTSEEKEFEGYELVEKPESEEYEYLEEQQNVTYKYQKIKVKVKTIVHGIGGEIVGDEEVLYGDDSTKDKIVIKAKEGYQIESVKINGEEMKLKTGLTRLVVDYFEGMKEDKLVEVTFTRMNKVVNPPTGHMIYLLLSLVVFISILFSIKYFKDYKFIK